MASYYDAYDSRPRPQRRSHSFSRSRDESYMKPSAGYAREPTPSAGREGQLNPQSSQPQRYTYDPRYHYPPPLPLDARRPGRPQRSPIREQFSWPPQPSCEDEAASLAKEAGSHQLLSEVEKDEAPSRGTADQEPIIQDAPGFVNNDEKRYVVVAPSEGNKAFTGVGTPLTSEDERVRRARRRPSKLNTNVENSVPEMSRRTASPYAFTRPTKLHGETSSNERFLSPHAMTPPPTDSGRRRARFEAKSNPSSPRRDSVRTSPSGRKDNDYFFVTPHLDENAIDDTDWDTSDSASNSGRRKVAKSVPIIEAPNSSPRTAVVDFAATPPNAPSIRRLNPDARRNTDTTSTLPTLQKLRVDKSRRPTPLMASSALTELHNSTFSSRPDALAPVDFLPPPPPRSRESSYVSSRAVSPASIASHAEPSPPLEPRLSSEKSRESGNGSSPPSSKAGSRPESRPDSRPGSRPSSPSPRIPGDSPRIPRTDLDWSTLLAANAARRTKSSRLATSARQESMSEASRTAFPNASAAVRPAPELPYPEHDGPATPSTYMPSERDYQYLPSTQPVVSTSYTHEPRTPSGIPSPAPGNVPRGFAFPVRPNLPTRHSIANVPPTEERPKQTDARSNSFSTSSQTKKELAALLKKGLPDCPRSEPATGYDDWYTVIGAPNLDFCPSCIDSVFERTVYRPSIRRSPPRNLDAKVQCAFGSPWMRLAWLLTLQQQRTDLLLLKDIADIEGTSEPCPGSREAVHSWYGLRDPQGYFVYDFHVCHNDVRKIECLLPTLSGFFVRLPHRVSSEKRVCAMRVGSNRFTAYMDALITTHDKALKTPQGVDPMSMIDLVERKTRLRECTRDNMLIGGFWYFMPNIPALTVCEDCYEAIVEPEVQKNSDIAMRFNRTAQPIYSEGMGSSCQLYSRRMRKVFQRAVQEDDLRYLARKANERREAELRLQEKYKDVMRRAKRLSREGSGSVDDERKLNRELERITEEWQTQWE